jgi:hypothetical protein
MTRGLPQRELPGRVRHQPGTALRRGHRRPGSVVNGCKGIWIDACCLGWRRVAHRAAQQTALRQTGHPPAKVPVPPRGRVRPPRFLTDDVVREHVGVRRQGGAGGGRPLDLAVVVGAEGSDDIRIEGDLAAGTFRARGRPIDWPGGTRAAVGMGGAVGPDHDHTSEARRRRRRREVEVVPAQGAECPRRAPVTMASCRNRARR